ncbi:Xylose isomerase domain-containing protein TIM barrel [Planctomycetales bacterium 10988]|nr:Xylose isomerase domain-containing protein TIM barrel [Planctomycetales bacterium 10988]
MQRSRRDFLKQGTLATAAMLTSSRWLQAAKAKSGFELKYIVGSCMYGTTKLSEILPEVRKTGATAIDIWPKRHGDQREQLEAMGEEAFAQLLAEHEVQLGCITQYPLGPFGLQEEMQLAERFNCPTMVTGGKGERGLSGTALKQEIKKFIEKMKPHLEVAEATGVTIAIENHGNSLVESPDSLKWLAEFRPSKNLGIALAPYHLEQDSRFLAQLIRDLGDSIEMFYAWEHGMGCMEKLPKEQELLQMPGRGELEFGPLLDALAEIKYSGWTEIFMHPVPRGIPILEPTSAVTAEINRARKYLASCMPNA